MFSDTEKITFKCENCYESTSSFIESCIFEVKYYIFLKNKNIDYVDYDSRKVYTIDGQVIPFTVHLDPDTVCEINSHMIHRFCSEECEKEIIKKHSMSLRRDLYKELMTIYPQEMDLHILMSININQIKTVDFKCEICNNNYKEFDQVKDLPLEQSSRRRWVSYRIKKYKKEISNYPNQSLINSLQSDYPIALTGLNKNKKTYGSIYFYNIDMESSKHHNICGTECGLYLSRKNNFLIMTNSLIEKGRLGVICPKSKEINKDLKNKVLSRPTFM